MQPKKLPKAAYSVTSYYVIGLSIILLALVAFAAIATESLPLAEFAGASFVLMSVLRAWGLLGVWRLGAEVRLDTERIFRGDTLHVAATLSNRKPLPVWMRFSLAHNKALELQGEGAGEGGTPDEGTASNESALLPWERIEGRWDFLASKRGVHTLGPAVVEAGDLLDLSRTMKTLPFGKEIIVYPRILPVRRLDLPFREYFGIHPAKGIVEDPAWYEGTREYTGTRSAKHIHWKASARFDSLQEKIFEPTTHRKIFILLDGEGFRRAEDREGFEHAVEIAASLASRFAEEGASFAIATDRMVKGFPPVIPLGRGPEHLGVLLELLARCDFEHGQPLLPLVAGAGHQGAGFVVVARHPGNHARRFLSLPSSRRDRILFVFQRTGDEEGESVAPELAAWRSVTFAELETAT